MALTRSDWATVGGMAAVVLALHALGFGLLLSLGGPAAGIGITAYTLGLRHAFDADHIAAIDNTTRKLMGEGRRPLSVGFFFALGHSTIVFALAAGLTLGIHGLGHSWLHSAGGVIGPAVSGTFLWLIGILNLAVLVGIVRVIRDGELDEAELERRLANRGLLNRLYRRATGSVRAPWQMYPLGMLFGLGFDTATEVALLATAGAAAAGGLPTYAILCLPVLFAAGMTLLDAIDGAFMNVAYGWAFSQPVRKVFYNLTITWLSVVAALAIGTIELVSVLAERLSLTGEPWTFVSGLDLNAVGYALAALFALTWLVALAVWRLGRFEEKLMP